MTIKKFVERLEELGCPTQIDGEKLLIDFEGNEIIVAIEDEWKKSINSFYRARQFKFNGKSKYLTANRFVEFQVVRLHPNYIPRPEFEFTNTKGDRISIGSPSNEFVLSCFNSDSYEESFDFIKKASPDDNDSSLLPPHRTSGPLPLSAYGFSLPGQQLKTVPPLESRYTRRP